MNQETKDKNIDIPINSIILTIGPTQSGKSYFSKCYLWESLFQQCRYDRFNYPILKGENKVFYVSSDGIRRFLNGGSFEDYDKWDIEMTQVSNQAFDMLFNHVRNLASYPVNADYIIVDTKGISEEFRNQMMEIAKEKNYNIGCFIFDYKDRDDYYNFIPTVDQVGQQKHSFIKKLISRDISSLKKKVMSSVKSKDYDFIYKIRDQYFDQYNIYSSQFEEFNSRILNKKKEYFIVGDVHGCIDELKELLKKNDFDIGYYNNYIINTHKDNKKREIVLVGDIIDKNDPQKIRETIDFVYSNMAFNMQCPVRMVTGNHENFVVKYLRGQINKNETVNEEFIADHFNTINIIKDDEDMKNKLFYIYDNSKEFYIHSRFIVTHAPCKNKYLAKLDNKSRRAQRMITYPKESEYNSSSEYIKAIEDHFSFIQEDSQFNGKFHFFGHVPCKSMVYKNKYNLDTGCADGGRLTCAIVNQENDKPFFQSVGSNYENVKNLYRFFERKTLAEQDVDLNELEPKELTRIKYFCKEKVPYISGTVCPSDKNEEDNDIESIEKAIEYYRSKGVEKMVLQPKYMGSRCNVILHKDVENSYAITRRGYRINHVDNMEKVYNKLREKFDYKFKNGVKYLFLDCELMPWKALGKGLIENQFEAIDQSIQSEIDFLKKNNFEEEFNKKYNEYLNSSFEKDSKNLSKKDLADKYGHAVYTTFKHIKDFSSEFNGIEEREKLSQIYNEQLSIYGKEEELDIKPFMILKEVYDDDSEKVFISENESNSEIFNEVSEDNYAILYFDDLENFPNGRGEIVRKNMNQIDHRVSSALECAQEFNSYLTTDLQMEGFVIKPDQVYIPSVAPFLKVRNKDYLTLVYGYDYKIPSKYKKLLNRKKINSKLRISIEEYEVGKRLLEIPYNQINEDNNEYKQLLAKMIIEEKKEEELDPRL